MDHTLTPNLLVQRPLGRSDQRGQTEHAMSSARGLLL
jgi:hypothetical protein